MPNFGETAQNAAEIWRFFNFSRWRRPPSWIFKSWKFWLRNLFTGPICINVPNFVLIAWTVADDRFWFFQMAAVFHLGFWKVRIFNCPSGTESQYASPSQISCRSVELLRRHSRFSVSQDSGRPPSWICFACIWTTHEEHLLVFVSVQNLVGIGAVVSNFRWYASFNVLRVWLKNAYSRPFLGGFWGIWPPRWDTISTNLTKVLILVYDATASDASSNLKPSVQYVTNLKPTSVLCITNITRSSHLCEECGF